MIKSTFTFIPGIGEKTEEDLWRKGIFTWNDLKKGMSLSALNGTRGKIIRDYIQKAEDALSKSSSSFFAEHLPQKEHWRLYKAFLDKTVFLDIETTGLSLYYDVITLIGTFDSCDYKFFVKDTNLEKIVDHLRNYEIIVTFNGKLFDVPFIKKQFPEVKIPPIHIDLRFLLQSLGITGPLKETEKRLNIDRPEELQGIGGRGAAVLWSRFLKGDNESLRKLILYNICDTANLKTVLDFCYRRKIEKDILAKMHAYQQQEGLFRVPPQKMLDFSVPSNNFVLPKITISKYNNSLKVLGDRKPFLTIYRERIKRTELKIDRLIQRIRRRGRRPVSVGIDLSGSEKKLSGFCVLRGKKAYLMMVRTDKEILSKSVEAEPSIISIDSPLSLPKGRCCPWDSCKCREHGIMRECEKILKRRGVNVYPCLIKSMQNLTNRGMRLSKTLKKRGSEVIESYPGAAQDILRFPRKRINLAELEIDLMNMGIKPFSEDETITHDEIDALTSALVGYFYLAGMYEAVGDFDEGFLIVPDINGLEETHGRQ